jgi:hypothetical protein
MENQDKEKEKTENEEIEKEKGFKRIRDQIKTHKRSFTLYLILRGAIIVVMILNILGRDWQNVAICIASLGLFLTPGFIESKWHVRLSDTLTNIILLFIFAAEVLGEIGAFYVLIPWWDTMLHTLSGFLIAGVGFSLVHLLNDNKRILFTLSPVFIVLTAFCFSMTVGVFWEFIEFSADQLWGVDMQKDTVVHDISSVLLDPDGGNRPYSIDDITSTVVNGEELPIDGYLDIGLLDTMNDLGVCCIGAGVFCTIGYISMKKGEKSEFMEQFVVEKESKSKRKRRKKTNKQ